MRVLFVHEDRRGPGEGGGAESLLRDQTEALKRLGHEVAWLQSGHIEVAVDQFRPDVVHVMTIHNFLPNWQGMVRWLQEQRVPHVWALMDYWPFCLGRMLLRNWIDGPACSAVDGVCDGQCAKGRSPVEWAKVVNGSPVVALNEHTAAIYRRNGIRADFVVELGVDVEMFRPDPARRDRDVSIYTTSAWPDYPVKGMPVLARAMEGTEYRANLVAHQPRATVAEALRRAHVHVFPSIYEETWGLCLSEAMASGCACIASDVAGARAQIHEEWGNGILVPPADPAALRDAIEEVMRRPDKARRMGERAREHAVQDHSLEAMGRRWERVYEAVREVRR